MSAVPARPPPGNPVAGNPVPGHLVHSMGRELTPADWPVLTDHEVRAVLARYPELDNGPAAAATVAWRSPRPMSAAALIRLPPGNGDPASALFMKRHHPAVRSVAQLAAEHAFGAHLRRHGLPVPEVLRDREGMTALQTYDRADDRADDRAIDRAIGYVYEVHRAAEGLDLYRDAVSWSPFRNLRHARAAGAALARLHLAAAGFQLPERPPAALLTSCAVVIAADPLAEVARFAARLPGLARYLSERPWPEDFGQHLLPLIRRAAPALRALPRQWGHGDWHPSNLTWTTAGPDAAVAAVLDLGLANRTQAVHDLATALERATVPWLDLAESGHAEADTGAIDALLDGYESARPLAPAEAVALAEALPVVHVEFALTEIEYFDRIVRSASSADLAYHGYLLGHARWFTGPQGSAVLDHLRQRADRRPARAS